MANSNETLDSCDWLCDTQCVYSIYKWLTDDLISIEFERNLFLLNLIQLETHTHLNQLSTTQWVVMRSTGRIRSSESDWKSWRIQTIWITVIWIAWFHSMNSLISFDEQRRFRSFRSFVSIKNTCRCMMDLSLN